MGQRMEEKITFMSGGIRLEGLLDRKPGDKGAVITHPHPLYGGDMYNPVVESLAGACQTKAYSTLRFNFRGVGNSRGSHAGGIGEQEDVRAALAYLLDLEIKQIDLAGYSFGAWVNAHLSCRHVGIHKMLMVSPPVAFIDFDDIGSIACLKLIVTGSRDDIAPVDRIRRLQTVWNSQARVEIIEGADHFYWGCTDALASILKSSI